MSTQSTPRSARTARSASPVDNSPKFLTPGQKIKAMMAQFDSDSDSDSQLSKPKASMPKLDFKSRNTSTASRAFEQPNDSDNDSEVADEIVRPKGRMAARMQGDVSAMTKNTEPQDDSAFSRLSKTLRTEREEAQKPTRQSPSPAAESSDDELPAAFSRRRTNAQSSKSPVSPDYDTAMSPSRARSFSPLFVSSPGPPQNNTTDPEHITDGEFFDKPKSNARFLSLVAQKRKEREERERMEEEQRATRRAQLEHFSSEFLSGEESEGEEAQSAQNLTQKARKPRKASKKALEEMRQETQRMTRNMQLAHQAQTKMKITKESLFARFNFMQPQPSPAEAAAANSSSTAGSQHSSDGETAKKDKETPRTSPVLGPSDAGKALAIDTVRVSTGLDEHSVSAAAVDKAHGSPPITHDEPKESTLSSAKKVPRKPTQPPVRVLLSRQEVARHQKEGYDSDDDLEVVTSPSKARRIAAFENLPTRKLQESSSMLTLKALAHLTSPTRKHTGMNSAELSANLLLKARQQAAKERRERIEELRAKGIVIETAEERASMEDDIENMMEKARQEADEIARKEKAENKKTQGLVAHDDDDEDDEFYLPSGSDEDASNDEDDDEEDNDVNNKPGFLDEEADENDESTDDQAEDELSDVDMLAEAPSSRRKRRTLVVNDDEEEEPQVPSTPVRPPSHDPQTVERPLFPGMETPGNMPMGLTQAFAGTLADDDDTASQPASSAMPFSLPDPGLPVPRLRAEDSEILVRDSQEQANEHDFMTGYNQSVTRVSESPATHKFSQFSQLPDPTQDQGFVYSPFDPAKRFRGTPPVSTVDTVLVGQSESPIAERKSRQLRRGRAANLSMVEEDENEGDFEINANAFNVMKKAAKKVPIAFDKKNSKAKNIVDEAAEESEDEYAGLGGASDDSEGEEDAYDQQMINDQSGEVVDEKQLAAMNAMHQRARDEKDVAKLYKDITTGALRRRRGGDDDLDLDDSDDERLARQRQKQREFAKMRRALLADDKIGQLADDPKKAAFFKAIEDREDEDDFELEFLEDKAGDPQNEASQDAAQEQNDTAQDSKKRKRPLEPSDEDATNRPPRHLRRTRGSAMSKKPATLAEIRETLSFLTETPEYDSFHEDASVDEEEPADAEDDSSIGNEEAFSEDVGSQSKEGFAVPRNPRRTRGVVVDRLALLRQASSNSASATTSGSSTNTKFAFHSGGKDDAPLGFRPPQLLRRMNTGSSSSSSSSTNSSNTSRVTQPAPSGPKKGGAINSYTAAREKEREKQLRMKQRNGGSNIAKLLAKHPANGLGGLAGKGQWE